MECSHKSVYLCSDINIYSFTKNILLGLGDNWALTILETTAESQGLNLSLRQDSCQECWIGESPNLNHNDAQFTGILHINANLSILGMFHFPYWEKVIFEYFIVAKWIFYYYLLYQFGLLFCRST